ncbi:MAG: hypothetical protein ACRDVG_05875 [Jatrophihabitantaceae bacterium]
MSSRSGELLDGGLDFFATFACRLGEDDWARPTPCAGWTHGITYYADPIQNPPLRRRRSLIGETAGCGD